MELLDGHIEETLHSSNWKFYQSRKHKLPSGFQLDFSGSYLSNQPSTCSLIGKSTPSCCCLCREPLIELMTDRLDDNAENKAEKMEQIPMSCARRVPGNREAVNIYITHHLKNVNKIHTIYRTISPKQGGDSHSTFSFKTWAIEQDECDGMVSGDITLLKFTSLQSISRQPLK